ncbi:hypothetical protein ALC53_00278 [Atta colombica]|uniref:Uncharacterized protein n=1 Tax=Atta colombica TaxID=520822 RepID=A0A195BZJ2_9HYME|nr:hypothetical protein ALC53_00278 [Atta colombica]
MKRTREREGERATWGGIGWSAGTEKVDNGISRARVEDKMAGTLAASRAGRLEGGATALGRVVESYTDARRESQVGKQVREEDRWIGFFSRKTEEALFLCPSNATPIYPRPRRRFYANIPAP